MAFVAKYFSQEYLSKQIATLSKALESVSTNLSIIALLGLALVPMVPDRAASTLSSAVPPSRSAAASIPAPVEIVRAKPVLVPQAPLPPALLPQEAALRVAPPSILSVPAPEADDTTGAQTFGSLRVLARVSRERRRRAQQQVKEESGDAGKAGTKTASAAPVPLPDPKSEAAKVEPPEWSDTEIIAALKDCLKRLAPLGAEIDIAPAVKDEQCGAPAPVLLKRIGSGAGRVEFQPPPILNCAMVAGLHTWIEKTLQPTAQDVLGTTIVRLRGTGGYACRNRNGSRHDDRLSEHALANAIDIMGFVTADGRTIDVLNKWGPTARDIREQKERIAEAQKERAAEAKAAAKTEAKVAAKPDDKDALQAARDAAKRAQEEAGEAEKSAAKAPRNKRKQAQAEAKRKRDEWERKADIAERLGEEAEQRAVEQRRGSLRTAGLQKLGKGVDAKTTDTKATPTTAAGNDAARPTAEATFLRRLHKGACSAFGTVLGPEANEAHRNHFHFDLAPRRRSSFCE
jgi:hypothetical protein